MIKIHIFQFNNFGENTILLIDQESRKALLVDPGMSTADERKAFDDFIAAHDVDLQQIVNTHLHLDHCFGADYVRNRYGVKLAANPADAPLGRSLGEQMRRFGMRGDASGIEIDVELHDGDTIALGRGCLEVIAVPGHSPGGIALYDREDGFVITGDSLFKGSIGRTDLLGGDYAALVGAVRERLLTLPPSTLVVPGHGPVTTISAELASNPFFK